MDRKAREGILPAGARLYSGVPAEKPAVGDDIRPPEKRDIAPAVWAVRRRTGSRPYAYPSRRRGPA